MRKNPNRIQLTFNPEKFEIHEKILALIQSESEKHGIDDGRTVLLLLAEVARAREEEDGGNSQTFAQIPPSSTIPGLDIK